VDDLTFEWDDAKAQSNLAKHGVAFATAAEAFSADDGEHIEDLRRAYGEARFNLRATVEGFPLIVTYTVRAGVVRIISARKANRKER
jgi:uncharacterized DUF497 family protein